MNFETHVLSHPLIEEVIRYFSKISHTSVISMMYLNIKSKSTHSAVKCVLWLRYQIVNTDASVCKEHLRWSFNYKQFDNLVQWFPTQWVGPSTGSQDKSEGLWDDEWVREKEKTKFWYRQLYSVLGYFSNCCCFLCIGYLNRGLMSPLCKWYKTHGHLKHDKKPQLTFCKGSEASKSGNH